MVEVRTLGNEDGVGARTLRALKLASAVIATGCAIGNGGMPGTSATHEGIPMPHRDACIPVACPCGISPSLRLWPSAETAA
eukprot:scaffold326353_cov55-Tisochrysis_lutea.AAC.11